MFSHRRGPALSRVATVVVLGVSAVTAIMMDIVGWPSPLTNFGLLFDQSLVLGRNLVCRTQIPLRRDLPTETGKGNPDPGTIFG